MELKDGSEQVRIKKEMAEKLRKEADELDFSVPETLYFMMHIYFNVYKKGMKLVIDNDPPKLQSSKNKKATLVEIDDEENSDDSDESNESYRLEL
jgi:hypothetical protein